MGYAEMREARVGRKTVSVNKKAKGSRCGSKGPLRM